MDRLNKIINRCKCGVHLNINQHRDYYQSAEQMLEELDLLECLSDLDGDVRKIMIDRDTIIDLQFYPDTPIGSYSIYHYDLDAALDQAFECLNL